MNTATPALLSVHQRKVKVKRKQLSGSVGNAQTCQDELENLQRQQQQQCQWG